MKRGQAEFTFLFVVLEAMLLATIVFGFYEMKQKGDREREAHEERLAKIKAGVPAGDGGTP